MPNRRRKVSSTNARRPKNASYLDKRIKLLVKENPRRPGTDAGKRIGSMISYVRKHPKAKVKEVYQKTSFHSTDLGYAIQHGWAKVVAS